MYRPIGPDKIVKKPGQPSGPVQSPLYQVGYSLMEHLYQELSRDDEKVKKVKRRTTASAAQFKARHLSSLGDQASITVLDALGMYIISSRDRDLLAALPKKFGSFERGEVERVAPKRPCCRPLQR